MTESLLYFIDDAPLRLKEQGDRYSDESMLERLQGEQREQLLNEMERRGRIAPRKDGVVKELGQVFQYEGQNAVRAFASTAEELGMGPGMRQKAEEWMARNQHLRPYPGHTTWSLDPVDIARTVGGGIAQSLGGLAVGAATTIATGGNAAAGTAAMTTFMFGRIYGDRVKEYREAMPGVAERNVKALALVSSLGESLIESYIGPEQAALKLFGKSAGEKAVGAAVKSLVKNVGKDEALAILGGGKATAELAKALGKDASEELLGKAVKKLGKQGLERLAQETVRDLAKSAANKSLAAMLGEAAKKVGGEAALGFATEFSEEGCQSYWNALVKAMGTHNLELPPWEEVRDEMMAGGWTGLFMGGGNAVMENLMKSAAPAYGETRGMATGETVPADATPVAPVTTAAETSRETLTPEEQAKRDERKAMAEKLATMSGMDIVWLTPDQAESARQRLVESGQTGKASSVGGWYQYDKAKGKGTAYINVADERGVDFVIGHELYHDMTASEHGKQSGVGLAVRRLIREAVKGKGEHGLNAEAEALYGSIRDLYRQYEEGSSDFSEEFEADVWGRMFTDTNFMFDVASELERRQTGMGPRFVKAIMEFVDKVLSVITGGETPTSQKLLNNYETARQEMAKLAADYTETNIRTAQGAMQSLVNVLYGHGPAERDADEAKRIANRQAGRQEARRIAQERDAQVAEELQQEADEARKFMASAAERETKRREAEDKRHQSAVDREIDRLSGEDMREKANMAANNREAAEIAEEEDRKRKAGREGRNLRGRTENYQKARKKAVAVPSMTHPDGTKVPDGTIYAIVDVAKNGDVVTSYDGGDYDQALQNSDTGVGATELVARHSDNPNASLMLSSDSTSQGIPVVDPDTGDVIIHNTGVMIRRAMAEKGTDREYIEKLKDAAKRLKIPYPDTARTPMLVAYFPENMSRDAKLEQAKKGNMKSTRSVDTGQRAASDATALATAEGQKVIAALPESDSDRLVSDANSSFISAAYALLPKEDGDLVDGYPTDKFNERLENAMMSLLFSGLDEETRTHLVSTLVNSARNLGLADFKSALAVKAAKLNQIALKDKRFDLRPELARAVTSIVAWKRVPSMKYARDYANQLNFDPKDNMPEADRPLFLALGNASQISAKAVRQVLDTYIDGARAEIQGQTLIGDKVTKESLIADMARASDEIVQSRKFGAPPSAAPEENAPAKYSLSGEEERIDKKAIRGYINSLNEKRKPYSPQPSLDIDYEERNDAHSQGEKTNQANARKDAIDCLRRCGGSLLGLSVTKDYKSVSATSLVGKTIASAEDLADAAQIYRNPHFETFRYVFVKDSKVVYANAITSRMPGATVTFVGNDAAQFIDQLNAEYDKAGADGYYLLHNHPSGSVSFSGPDIRTTLNIAKKLRGNFLGHVVIDHRQYSVIDSTGQISEALSLTPSTNENQYDPSKNPSKPNSMLGMRLTDPGQVASAAEIIQYADSLPDGSLVLFGTTPQLKISCIASIPVNGMKKISEKRLYATARQLARASTSVNFFLANVSPKDENYVLPAVRSGLLLDATMIDGTSIRQKHAIPVKPYEYLGLDIKGKSAVTEKDAVRHSLTGAELNAAAKKDGIDLDRETQEFRDVYSRYRSTPQWMKAPNGKTSKLNARQWVQVRTPAFKKWAGDWEMVSGATPDIDVRSYDEGRKVLMKLSGKDMQSADGLPAVLSHASIDKIFSGKAVSKSISPHAHIVAAANLGKLYSNARELHIPEEGNRQGIKYMHRLYAPFLFDGQPLVVKISVKEFTSGESNKLYTIETMDIEKPAGILVPERSKSGTDTPAQATEDKIHQLLDDFKKAIENTTKVLDENGEPKVVYHGSKWNPLAEKEGDAVFRTGKGNTGSGAHFGTYQAAQERSEGDRDWHITPAFLNMRNPLRVNDTGYWTPNDVISEVQKSIKDFPNVDNWNDIVAELQKRGYDGFVYENAVEDEGSDSYVALNANQIKSATDNTGAFSNENKDIRYSLTSKEEDAAYMAAVKHGDMETVQKMVDKAAKAAGYITKAYHGTPNGTFNVFNGWQYFTEDKSYADKYQRQGASSISYKQTADKPRTYGVYLKTDKPFDTRNETERRIFEDEFFGKWGNATPLTERGIPDWTDGEDLTEFFEEKGYDYDSIYLDEGGTGGYGEEVNDRGISIMIKNPEQIKSADPITYDENGKVIPLSKRFNKRDQDIRYSIGNLYTGSAADYDKPSLHYIGTGEGAQVYGWGLYSTDNRDIAKWYAEQDFKRKQETPSIDITYKGKRFQYMRNGEQSSELRGPEFEAARLIFNHNGDIDAAWSDAMDVYSNARMAYEERPDEHNGKFKEYQGKIVDLLFEGQDSWKVEKHEPSRHLYRQTWFLNRVNDGDANLLDWNNDVTEEQQHKIANALSKLKDNQEIITLVNRMRKYEAGRRRISEIKLHDSFTEKTLRKYLFEKIGNQGWGENIYDLITNLLGSPKAASKFLRDNCGIDGIRYPAGSHGGGDGSKGWNYVSFSDTNMRVDEHVKWSLAKTNQTFNSLSRNQSNPIVSDGKVRADYQELLDNGRYTPEHVAQWEASAAEWIKKVGGVENAVDMINDGLEPSGKIGTMARRMIMETETFRTLPQEKQRKVELRNIMQGTEWGREGAARRISSMTLDSAPKVRAVIDAIRSKLTPQQSTKMKDDVLRDTGIDIDSLPADIHNDREKLDGLISSVLSSKATTKDKLYEYWINAILSAPMTHVANTVGNLANLAYELGFKRLAEVAVNQFARRPDAARLGEFKSMWSAVDLKTAWRSAVQAFNIETLDANGKYVEAAAPAIEGKKGRIVRLPGRFLRAADEFAKAIIVPVETAAMADRLGRQQGLEGAALESFIRDQLRDGNSASAAFGRRRSLELTFQEDPGKVVMTLVSLKNGDGWAPTLVKYMFPFMKTPYNLLRQGIRKSPLGAFSLIGETYDVIRGNRTVDTDYISHAAEQVLAWGLVGMALSMGGGDNDDDPPRLTGTSSPGTPGERMFRGRHVPAYSIRIGDKYYSYKRIEPLSTMLALVADSLEAYHKAKTEEGASAALRDMFTGATRLIGEKSYLNTFSQIVQLFDEPERSLGSWATDFTASWMPNAIRQASNAFDDYRRDPAVRTSGVRWWRDQFHVTLGKAGILRMAPKVDCFGRPITKDEAEKAGPGDILWRLLVPVNTKAANAMDPAERLIWNWNTRNPDAQYWPGIPSFRFTDNGVKYEMHGKVYADFSMEAGRMAHRRILKLINTGHIKPSRPRETDINQIKQILTASRRQIREKYVAQHRCDRVK